MVQEPIWLIGLYFLTFPQNNNKNNNCYQALTCLALQVIVIINVISLGRPKWSEWESWSTCSTTCEFGTRNRLRNCVNSGGMATSCSGGSPVQTEPCFPGKCPVDGQWGAWGSWSQCPQYKCYNGTGQFQTRERSCDAPRQRWAKGGLVGVTPKGQL